MHLIRRSIVVCFLIFSSIFNMTFLLKPLKLDYFLLYFPIVVFSSHDFPLDIINLFSGWLDISDIQQNWKQLNLNISVSFLSAGRSFHSNYACNSFCWNLAGGFSCSNYARGIFCSNYAGDSFCLVMQVAVSVAILQ